MYPNVMTNEPIRIKRAKQAIQDFKKANGNPKDVIDLMLFFVERGSQFTSDLGDIDEDFYCALENMYAKAIDTILSLPEKDILSFKDRLEDILDSTSGIGWGYHEELTHIYYEKFSDYCD